MSTSSRDRSPLADSGYIFALHAEVNVEEIGPDPLIEFRPTAIVNLVRADYFQESTKMNVFQTCQIGPHREDIVTRAKTRVEEVLVGSSSEHPVQWVTENWKTEGRNHSGENSEVPFHQRIFTELLVQYDTELAGKRASREVMEKYEQHHPQEAESSVDPHQLALDWGRELAECLDWEFKIAKRSGSGIEFPQQAFWPFLCTNCIPLEGDTGDIIRADLTHSAVKPPHDSPGTKVSETEEETEGTEEEAQNKKEEADYRVSRVLAYEGE